MTQSLFPDRLPSFRASRFAVLAFACVLCWSVDAALAQGPPEEGGGAGQGPPPALVRVATVRSQTMQDRWRVVGRLEETRSATVAAEQSGRVVGVFVDEGDSVVGGETVLARIDDVWARIALATAEAELTEAEAGVEQAKARVIEAKADYDQSMNDLKYLQDLEAERSAKPREVTDARFAADAARARLEQARASVASNTGLAQSKAAEVDRARESLERLTIVAPFDGVVVAKLTEQGQWLDAGAVVAEVITRDPIDAVVDVPERYINNLAIDDSVGVLVEALNTRVQGRVIAIVPLGQRAARTFPVKIRLDNPDGQLKAGMSVQAMVPMSAEREYLTVPRDAVQRTESGTIVWVARDQPQSPMPVAMQASVRVVFGEGDRYAVEAQPGGMVQLAEGMRVVIEGAEGDFMPLFPTRPLNIANPGDVAAPAPEADAG